MHDVIAAITTAPWSSTNSPYSSDFTVTGLLTRPFEYAAADCTGARSSAWPLATWPGSLAGNVSSSSSSSFEYSCLSGSSPT